MKFLALLLLPFLATPALAGNFFGPGPFSMDGYWPGFLNGKYQAAVTGISNNITGVVEFALVEGAPPSRTTEEQEGGLNVVARNVQLGVDPFQNYFMIFVEGRTYAGVTSATINLNNKTVVGALQGTDPAGIQPVDLPPAVATGDGVTIVWPVVALPILNRGLNGGFRAKLKDTKALMTFKGTGSLNTPSQRQTFTATSIPAEYVPTDDPPSPEGSITNVFGSALFTTETVDFRITGLRTSYFSTNAVSTAVNDR